MEEKKSGKSRKEIIRAIKFALVSASAGLVEFGVFFVMNELTELKYWPCYLTALIASVVWCFTINRRYTFKSTKNVPRAMAMVFAFYLVFTPATTILNMALNLSLEYLYDTFVVYRGEMDNNDIAAKDRARGK